MAKKNCDCCGKKFNSMNRLAYPIGNYELCSECLGKLKFSTRRKYDSIESIETAKQETLEKADELNIDNNLKETIINFYEEQKSSLQIKLGVVPDFTITTCNSVEDHHIIKYLGIVSGTMVLGSGPFSSINASVADLFSSESNIYTQTIKEAKDTAQARAIKDALNVGANALIGVDIEYTSLFDNLMAVMVTGTAVYIEKNKTNND